MKIRVLSVTLLTTAVLAGCSSTSGGSLIEAFNTFSGIVEGAQPFVQESEEWEKYSIDKTQQGVAYSIATPAGAQFVAKKMDAEYPAAIDRLSKPFAVKKGAAEELDKANKNYRFTYHNIMAVQEKQTAKTIGYCVSFDVNRLENGQPTAWDEAGNSKNSFIYVAQDKPLSIATANHDFIRRMCGTGFYNQYK